MPGAGRAQGGRALRAPAAEEALPGWLMPRAGAWGQRGFCTPQHEAALLKHAKMDFPITPPGLRRARQGGQGKRGKLRSPVSEPAQGRCQGAVVGAVVILAGSCDGEDAGIAGQVFGGREAVGSPGSLVLVSLGVVIEQVPEGVARALLVPGDAELADVVLGAQGAQQPGALPGQHEHGLRLGQHRLSPGSCAYEGCS